MAEEKKKMAPHEVLIQDLVKAKEGRFIGTTLLSKQVLCGLGAQLLSGADLKPEHIGQALEALGESYKKARDGRDGSIKKEIVAAIKELKKEERSEEKESKEE